MKKLLVLVVFGALLLTPALVSNASANMLQIIAAGLDLVYDGTDIYDAASINGGTGNPAEADPLDTMTFKILETNTTLGTRVNDIFADVKIGGVYNIPVGGGMVQNTGMGFGFDFLTKPSTPAWGLGLNLTSPLEIVYDGTNLNVLGTGSTNAIMQQDLPYGVEIGTPVQISFSGNIVTKTDNGQVLTSFTSSGSGEVTGPATPVPEPATLLLLGMGLLSGGVAAARRRARK